MSDAATPRDVLLLTAPAPHGGLETVVATLAAGLARAGHSVTVIQLLTPGAPLASALSELSHSNIRHLHFIRAARDYSGACADVRALLDAQPSAVLHAHGARADLIAALTSRKRRRFVSTVHGFVTNSVKQRLARIAHLLVLRRASRVVAVSGLLDRQLSRTVGRKRVVFIPNAPPINTLLPRSEARAALGVPSDARVIGWVGRASREKGLDVFVEAMALLNDREAVAVVIGDGPELNVASAKAEACGLTHRIRWLGAQSNAARLFAGLDLLVLSSRTEGTPMTVLEAIDARVPVVATAVGGVPDLLGNDAGWLVPSESPARLAVAIDEALRDRDGATRRADRAAQSLDARHGLSMWIAAHVQLYEESSVT